MQFMHIFIYICTYLCVFIHTHTWDGFLTGGGGPRNNRFSPNKRKATIKFAHTTKAFHSNSSGLKQSKLFLYLISAKLGISQQHASFFAQARRPFFFSLLIRVNRGVVGTIQTQRALFASWGACYVVVLQTCHENVSHVKRFSGESRGCWRERL